MEMKIVYKKVTDLIPYENNPRKNENAVQKVAESIKTFGFKVPITVDPEMVVVTGHTRLKAAIRLGLAEVPVIVLDNLTPDQIKAFRLVDNKTSEYAQWDMEALAIELKDIDLDLSIFDFEDMPGAGLTGRKIVCDQYGGYAPVGGGAFSGKDPTKVDRSAAYAARIYACELLEKYREKGIKEVTVQIGYAIGIPEPLSICVDLKGPGATQELHDEINENIDYLQFTPHNIIKRLNLKVIDYEKIAEGCHYYGLNR